MQVNRYHSNYREKKSKTQKLLNFLYPPNKSKLIKLLAIEFTGKGINNLNWIQEIIRFFFTIKKEECVLLKYSNEIKWILASITKSTDILTLT